MPIKINSLFARAALLAVMLAPSIGLTGARYFELQHDLTESAWARRQATADLSAAVLHEKFDHIKSVALSLATRVTFSRLINEGRWAEAVGILKSVPGKDFEYIERVFLADMSGVLKADYPEAKDVIGKDFSGRDWYQTVVARKEPIISEIYRRAAEPSYNVIAVAVPIPRVEEGEPGGGMAGILVLQIRLKTLLQWAQMIDTDLSEAVYFVDRHGHAAGWWDELLSEKDVPDYSALSPVREALAGERGVKQVRDPREGVLSVAAYSPVQPEGWAAVVEQPEAEVYADKRRFLRSFVVTASALIVLNAILALVVLRLIDMALRHQREKAAADAERTQLEIFAFVASHDLQEPLNKISSFGGLLREELGGQASPAALDCLRRIDSAAGRMRQMIDDVRTFSGIRQNDKMREVDLNIVMGEALDELKESIETVGAKVQAASLPTIRANAAQLKILFMNLLSNAIKYRSAGIPPQIEVDVKRQSAGSVEIVFRDNGIGFAEKYEKIIFEPFKRLHSQSQYAGTGLGLAICHRIAMIHGGRITATSLGRAGSEFTLILPGKH
ncbi:MAG: hypothetical protein KBD07_06305 [Candidatus Omnitrophica bacterium]|nr:hypothetical protein [Candidatus Omnitrophota bacterium]